MVLDIYIYIYISAFKFEFGAQYSIHNLKIFLYLFLNGSHNFRKFTVATKRDKKKIVERLYPKYYSIEYSISRWFYDWNCCFTKGSYKVFLVISKAKCFCQSYSEFLSCTKILMEVSQVCFGNSTNLI